MREVRKCVVCDKAYIATRANAKTCSTECSKLWNRFQSNEYNKMLKEKRAQEKKNKKKTVTDIAVEARNAGMTYGQYVAIMEYGMAVEQKN